DPRASRLCASEARSDGRTPQVVGVALAAEPARGRPSNDRTHPWPRSIADEVTVSETRLKQRNRRTLRSGVGPPIPRLTFRAAVRDVLDDYRINRKRSLVDVERHVRLHLAPFFGRRRMAAITTTDVRRYVVRRQDEGAKNATINRELSVLKRLHARDRGGHRRVPAAHRPPAGGQRPPR